MDAQVAAKHGGQPGVRYRLCFRVDKNGCAIAQATHEAVLKKFGLLQPQHQLKYGDHIPDSTLVEGVYIDDLLIARICQHGEVVPLDGSFQAPHPEPEDEDAAHVRAAEEAYEAAGLERAIHKAFRFETAFRAWGAEVDGVKGRVGAPVSVRRQVWILVGRVVESGWASKEVLQAILGYLSFIFQYRRECYLQHHLHKYVAGLAGDKWYFLPAHIVDELRSCALHLPFSVWNMRRRLDSRLLATDATPTSGGAVVAEAPDQLVRTLWRHTDVRGKQCAWTGPLTSMPAAANRGRHPSLPA